MEEQNMDKEAVKPSISISNVNADLFGTIEAKKQLESYLKEMSKRVSSLNKLKKAIDKKIIDLQSIIANEVRNGSSERVQFTLDGFKNLRERLEDIAYESFDDNTYDDVIDAVTDIEIEYDPETKTNVIKGLIK